MLQHYLVVGLGITGYSVIEYLVKQRIKITVTDSRMNPPELNRCQTAYPNIPCLTGEIVVPDDVTHIILSPGVALNTPAIAMAKKRGVEIYGDIELFAQVVDKPVIAITGSNGKSTTTALLGAMAKTCNIAAGVGGNLGTPALRLLNPDHTCYILELSSFQLETTHSLTCTGAAVLNISPDHMDRYASVADYAGAKLRIYAHTQVAIANRADPATYPTQKTPKVISFGLDVPNGEDYGVINAGDAAWLAREFFKINLR